MDCPVCRRKMLSTLIARDDPAAPRINKGKLITSDISSRAAEGN